MTHWQAFDHDVLFRADLATQSYQAAYGLRTILKKLELDQEARAAVDSGATEGIILDYQLPSAEAEGLFSAALVLVLVIEQHLEQLHTEDVVAIGMNGPQTHGAAPGQSGAR